MASASAQSIAHFPSKLKEPKVVIVVGNVQNNPELIKIQQTLKAKDVRYELLDSSKKSNTRYMKMFQGGPNNFFTKIFIYEDGDGDFMGVRKQIDTMIKEGKFNEEFEDCIGTEKETQNDQNDEDDKKYEEDFAKQSRIILSSGALKKKNILRYTPDELATYTLEQSLNDLTRNMIKYKVTGKDLKKINNPKQIMQLLHVNQQIANDFYEILQEEKEKEICRRSKKAFPEISDKWLNKNMIKWSIRETKGWINSFIKKQSEIAIVFKALDKYQFNGRKILRYDKLSDLCIELNIDESIGIIQQIISAVNIQMDKEMDSDEKNNDIKIKDEPLVFRIRTFRKYDFIAASKKEDCIMKYNDTDGIDRASMPCGHAIASDTMFYYIKSTFHEDRSASDIICPVPNCKKKWDWEICVMVADMDNDEKTKFNKIRIKRIYSDLTECPKCKKMCTRPKGEADFRVICSNCKYGPFCFECTLNWKLSSSKIVCGNGSCNIVKDLNATLKKTKWNATKISANEKREIPKIRACPRCLTLVIHKVACKHMPCKGCKKKFCFVCLALQADNGTWGCSTGNSYTGLCDVKPTQQFG